MLPGSELWLLRLMADRGRTLLGASSVHIVLEQGAELRVISGSSGTTPRVSILPVAGSALGAVHSAGAPLAVHDPSGPDAHWLRELGLQASDALVEPLPAEVQRGLVIALRAQGPRFAPGDVDALRSFAQSLVQRLNAERSVELERLRHGMEARERERTRWAREIHDETVQGLGGIRMRLALARDAADETMLREAVDTTLRELTSEIEGLRHLITELRPAALDDLGLVAALDALARRATAIDGLDVRTDLRVDVDRRFDGELESALYRVIQEALTNVAKHARATRVDISLAIRDGRVEGRVLDNGTGLGGGAGERAAGEGFGLSGMRERAELVGGDLEVSSHRGGGTEVVISVPLEPRRALSSAQSSRP
jgi:signal transduction histidine kinase